MDKRLMDYFSTSQEVTLKMLDAMCEILTELSDEMADMNRKLEAMSAKTHLLNEQMNREIFDEDDDSPTDYEMSGEDYNIDKIMG